MKFFFLFAIVFITSPVLAQSSYGAANQDERTNDPSFDRYKDMSSGYVKDEDEYSEEEEVHGESFDAFDKKDARQSEHLQTVKKDKSKP